jgi:hypothetical protein
MINKVELTLAREMADDFGGLEKYFNPFQNIYFIYAQMFENEEDFNEDFFDENLFFSSGKELNNKFNVNFQIELNFGAIIDEDGQSYFSNKKNAVKMLNFLKKYLKNLEYNVIVDISI